jgi:hypothetical protein
MPLSVTQTVKTVSSFYSLIINILQRSFPFLKSALKNGKIQLVRPNSLLLRNLFIKATHILRKLTRRADCIQDSKYHPKKPKIMKKNYFIIMLFFVIGYCSCKKSSSSVSNLPKPLNIYVAGYRTNNQGVNGAVDTATYWKNGAPVALSDGTNNAHANSIAVSGTDVYVAGDEYNGMNNVAKYWKNGQPFNLTGGKNYASATSIAVSGSDVYVAGYEYVGRNVAIYWKNGTRITLTDSTKNAFAFGIAVSGTDVYVAGYEQLNAGFGNDIAKYWKNGTPVSLTDGSLEAQAYSIAVSGTDVYVAGHEWNGSGTADTANFWKNGSPSILNNPDGSPGSDTWSVFVSGTDVYVAGSGNNGALYWKNSTPVALSNGTGTQAGTVAYGIAVSGTNIFAAGDIGNNIALYWNNGTPVTLSNGLLYVHANAIFLSSQ